MRQAGIKLIGTATAPGEAVMLEEAGCDAIVAQGSEAGGHRGTFALPFERALIGTVALVPQVADSISVPPDSAVPAAGDARGRAAGGRTGARRARLGDAPRRPGRADGAAGRAGAELVAALASETEAALA
jgi:nitronate monooxygenase